MVRLLLEENDVELNTEDVFGRTPLLWAASKGCEAIVRLLLERGTVNPNFKDAGNQTCLCLAGRRGHIAVVRILQARDDVDVKCNCKHPHYSERLPDPNIHKLCSSR